MKKVLLNLFSETYSIVFLSVKCWSDLSGGTGGTSIESLKGETSHTHIKECDHLISETWHTPKCKKVLHPEHSNTNVFTETKFTKKLGERKKERKNKPNEVEIG